MFRQLISVDRIAERGPRYVSALELVAPESAAQRQRIEEFSQFVDACKCASLLVLDDLGDEVTGGRRASAHEVIKHRFHSALPTIITTAIGAGLKPDAAFARLEKTYDDRIARRILTDGTVIDM
jgi:DNA replication protein DnaC